MNNRKKLEYFLSKREEHFKNFNLEIKKQREKFINNFILEYLDELKVLEMYRFEGDSIKNSERTPQYPYEYTYCNTRKKFLSETRAEIDRLPFDKSIEVICRICLELMKNNIHFAIFYAEGQRSPHIIIYDFDELRDLKPHQREKAQLEFWRSLIPFEVQNLDKGIWLDNHYVPLEFSPHWKYGTPFKLIWEYLP